MFCDEIYFNTHHNCHNMDKVHNRNAFRVQYAKILSIFFENARNT